MQIKNLKIYKFFKSENSTFSNKIACFYRSYEIIHILKVDLVF